MKSCNNHSQVMCCLTILFLVGRSSAGLASCAVEPSSFLARKTDLFQRGIITANNQKCIKLNFLKFQLIEMQKETHLNKLFSSVWNRSMEELPIIAKNSQQPVKFLSTPPTSIK